MVECRVLVNLANGGAEPLRQLGVHFVSHTFRPGPVHPLTRFEPPVQLQGEVAVDTHVEIGAFCGLYGGLFRHASIGRYASVAPGVQIGRDGHPPDWLTSSMVGYVEDVHGWGTATGASPEQIRDHSGGFESIRGRTVIGHDVWLGLDAFVSTGITIGDGAIVGASSVVTADVPPYAIVAGNPARLIRPRFPEDLVAELVDIQPWRYNLYDVPQSYIRDPREFVAWYRGEGHALLTPFDPGWIGVEEMAAAGVPEA